MFASLARAIANFFDGTLRGVILRSIALTLLLFVLFVAGVQIALAHLPAMGAPWVNELIAALAPLLFLVLLFTAGAPVAAVFASLFLERVARRIEARAYPEQSAAQGASTGAILGAGVRLAGIALVANFALLLLDAELPPPAPELIAILANGWLLGREYFELTALRHMSLGAATHLRRRHGWRIFAGGTIISLFSTVPIFDLLAPLFGTAFMVHLYMRIQKAEHPA